MESMKIINRTATEMTITHASRGRTAAGWVLIACSGALFVAEALGSPDSLLLAALILACFGFGVFLLFTNVAETIDLDKRASSLVRIRHGAVRDRATRYHLADAKSVRLERDAGRHAAASHLVLADGTRLLIDEAHGSRRRSISDEAREASIAEEVARFLGIPIDEGPREG